MTATPNIMFFKDIRKDDLPLVGGKGANLGEVYNSNFSVPNGFAITVSAYQQFLKENNLSEKISQLLTKLDYDNSPQLQNKSRAASKLVRSSTIPKSIQKDIVFAYKKISGLVSCLVAVRSSATAEDLPNASFAGQQATILNVKGKKELLEAVKECFASLYTARAIFYRHQNNIKEDKVKISVIVQKMVKSEVSGVMFSIDPVNNDKEKIIIEAVWGLGELIVQGSVLPDRYVVQKDTFSILYKSVSDQDVQMIKKGAKTVVLPVPQQKIGIQKISDEAIIELAKMSQRLQDHYYFPQDSEWAMEKGKLYLLQTRPVTTTQKKAANIKDLKQSATTPILSGSPASPGRGKGKVKIIKNPSQIDRVKEGDVLVAEMTSPDYVPAMKRASAIITDKGGMTSHAAIVSRELGTPCVVGTKTATKILKENLLVSVDGATGNIYTGDIFSDEKTAQKDSENEKDEKQSKKIKTATKIYINLAEPEIAKKASKLNVDGVGLLRAEFIIAGIGTHPKEAIKLKKQDVFVDKLSQGLSQFCKYFNPRPVVYRATDFKTNEYRALPGGKTWEPIEPNPMLGYRGAYRFVNDPEVFNLELKAIKKVFNKYKNLWLMVPFVRSPEELSKVRKMVEVEGLFEYPTFKFWMMVELPTNVIQIEDFIKVGIDGVSIGSNDLTMLITGTDRDNAEVSKVFDERSPSVYWALKRTIKKCLKHGVTTSICGQAPSLYEEYVKKLVGYGVTSISVNIDSIDRVRKLVYDLEDKK